MVSIALQCPLKNASEQLKYQSIKILSKANSILTRVYKRTNQWPTLPIDSHAC